MRTATSCPPARRYRTLGAAGLLLVTGLLAACGDDDPTEAEDPAGGGTEATTGEPAADEASTDEAGGSGDATAGAADEAEDGVSEGGTRTVATSLGDVEVPADPERVVVLNVQQASMAVSLGVEPVGVAGETSSYPWLEEDIGPLIDADLQDAAYTISPEAVAELDPDVILAGNWQLTDPELTERLESVAPVVTTDSEEVVPSWQDSLTTVGDALGLVDEAETLVTEIEAEYAELGDSTGTVGMTYQYMALADDNLTSGNALLLQLAGLEPGQHQDVDGVVSNNEISLERVPDLDADLLLLWNASSHVVEELPGFDSLPSVQSGNYHEIDLAQATALTGPEPIGLRGYLLDLLTPMLEELGGSGS